MRDTSRLGIVVALLSGCVAPTGMGGGASSADGKADGDGEIVRIEPSGEPVDAMSANGILHVPSSIAGEAGPYLVVDTGSPEVVIDPGALPDGHGTDGKLASLEIFGATFAELPFSARSYGSAVSPEIRGVVGCTVFCGYMLSLDYRASQVTLGDAVPPSGVREVAAVEFALVGGDGTAEWPDSRVVVDVDVEGTSLRMLVDTGAQVIVLSSATKETIVRDGREETPVSLGGLAGESDGTFYGLGDVSVAGARATRIGAVSAASLDSSLDALSAEVGEDLHGILGASFTSKFHVVFDYPRRTLRLGEY
jgi:hypothetical protein